MARTQPAKSVRPGASARTTATVEADASSVPSAAGTLLARYRKERGLTQGELGRLSQVATDTISALERGKRHVPQRETLDRLIKALDLAPEEAALFHAAANATRRSSRSAPAPAPRPPARTSDPVSREAQVEHELAFVHRPPAEAAESGQLASAAAAEPVNVRQAASDERHRGHGGRRRRWRLPLPGVTAVLAPVSLLLAALIIANLLIGRSQFASAASLPLSGAQVRGWLVYQQWATRKPSIMAVMDAATGEWRALWPDARFLGQGATSDTTETFSSLRAPAYSPAQHRLAFISIDSSTTNSVWVVTIGHSSDGWPVVEPPGPTEVIANCAGCGALSWSPDGAWLLYDAGSGLMAHAMATGQERRITSGVGDHWPSCSPDGQWLAFQQRRDSNGGIVVEPAADCLPLAQTGARHTLYLNGFNPSWRPTWSADSTMLAFVALTAHGQWSAWITRLWDLALAPSYTETSNAFQVSQPGCNDPVWATRQGGAGNAVSNVIIYSCDTPTADQHHGAIFVVPGTMAAPAWHASLDTNVRAQQGGIWMSA